MIGCPVVPPVDGHVAFDLNGVQAQNPGGSTEAIVIPVQLAGLPVHSEDLPQPAAARRRHTGHGRRRARAS